MSVDQRFLRETRSDLRALSDQLVDLEGPGAERAAVDEAFRTAHTLKGNLGMVGLEDAGELAHALEDLLDAVRAGDRAADGEAVDAALDAVDAIERRVEAAAEGRAPPDVDPARSRLRSVLGTDAGPTLPFDDVAEGADSEPTVEPDRATGRAADEASADTLPDLDGEAAAAFEGASEFDDLDALLDEMDDEDDLGPLEGGGSIDDLDETADPADATDPGTGAGTADDAPADEEAGDAAPSAPTGAYDEFAAMRDEFDGDAELEDLEADIAATDFGEFDDEDDMTIAELLETEPDVEPELAAADDGSEAEQDPEPTATDDLFDGFEATTGAAEASAGGDAGPAAEPDREPSVDTGREPASEPTAEASTASSADEGAADAGAGTAADATETADRSALSDVLAAMNGDESSEGGASGTDAAEATATDTASADTGGPSVATESTPSFAGASADAAGFTRDAATGDFESKFGDLFGGDEPETAGERRTATTLAESDIGGQFRSGEAGGGETLPAGLRTSGASSLTVDVEVGDELLQDVRRLGVAHRALAAAVDTDDRQVREALDSIETAVDGLRRTATTVRSVPISTVTDGFSRVVRRVARDAGVEAELRTRGTDIRLDRDVLDRIGDPLVHLVRNAVDHGIEPPAERREAGKPETGTVEVRARREGDRATIEVRDDGRGLDPAAIRERAVEQGVVSAAEAADLSVPGTYELVFEPGFSTADAVSETSGRGVGMDAVRQAVTDLNGAIEVESTRGEGTTVRLSVPVSVAVAEVVFVESGGRQYAVPTADVESIQRGSAVDAGGGTVAVRTPAGDREVPLVRLGDALGTAATGGGGDTGAVLRVDPSVREVALGCDAVGEKREVIITPYQDVLRGTPGIGGATLLDDNTVVNVIDVETL